MTVEICALSNSGWDEYDNFVQTCDHSLIYNSPRYLNAISKIVGSAPTVLVARRAGRIVGSIASFFQSDGRARILNSLPYFGSHGDILLSESENESSSVAESLAFEFSAMAKEKDVGSVNVVSHPISPVIFKFADAIGLQAWDMRIGQMTPLSSQKNREDAFAYILSRCTQKTRNLVKKGLRQGFKIRESCDRRDWDALIEAHTAGMRRIGGTPKTPMEFEAFRDTLHPSGCCRLYTAEKEGVFAGALLLLQHMGTVEYFTPAVLEAFRSEQALSAIIAHAMCDSILRGATLWNWGGTWSSQAGVYHFKQGWGAVDKPYTYWGRISDPILAGRAANALREEFRYFYVRPFHQEIS